MPRYSPISRREYDAQYYATNRSTMLSSAKVRREAKLSVLSPAQRIILLNRRRSGSKRYVIYP